MRGHSRRGVTLLELLVALAISGMIATALSAAFSSAVRYETSVPAARVQFLNQLSLADRLKELIGYAFVDEDQANSNTYFVGRVDPTASSALSSGQSATELIFTTLGHRPPSAGLTIDTTVTFEERNKTVGPVGGLVEVRLSTTPAGEAPNAAGLFLREQTPADEQPETGGYESVLDAEVGTMSFEFWDGAEWRSEWDTTTGERRLPAAVRVTYTLIGDESVSRELIVAIRSSDVTTANPANQGITGGAF